MSMDLHNNARGVLAINPVALGTTGSITGLVIDRQGFKAVEFYLVYGSVTTTGTTAAVTVKEGDVTGTLTSVADSDLVGTEANAALAATTPRTAGSTKEYVERIGYRGVKRYVQINLNHTGTTSVGIAGAIAVLHTPNIAPTLTP